jgi:hypothetical protein
MKSTACTINGKEVNIYKDPATDTDKIKKSLTGRVVVEYLSGKGHGGIVVTDGLSSAEESKYDKTNMLRTIFYNGELVVDDSLSAIRSRILGK